MASNIVWFFGAGASAPYGIPTMKQMVVDFERLLESDGSREERRLFSFVHDFLKANLGRDVDLEAVFTIVDSILNWSPERLGIAAVFHTMLSHYGENEFFEQGSVPGKVAPPSSGLVTTANALRTRFEEYVKSRCEVLLDDLSLINKIHGTLFDTVAGHLGSNASGKNRLKHLSNWPIFTANYDAILETYWRRCVGIDVNTGFEYNEVCQCPVSSPNKLTGREHGIRLFKLHGSITWMMDPEFGLTEQSAIPRDMRTYMGGRFSGQVMVYPIQEKELYIEPYMTMFHELLRALEKWVVWISVGYSFGDRTIREMFIRSSKSNTRLAILHPRADEVAKKLDGFRGHIVPVKGRLEEDTISTVSKKLVDAITTSLHPPEVVR